MIRASTSSIQERPAQRRRTSLQTSSATSSLRLHDIHRARRREGRLFGHAKTQVEASVLKIASSLEALLQFRTELDTHNSTTGNRSSDAESIHKCTKRAMKAKFVELRVAPAIDIINEATGADKNFPKTRDGFSKNTLCCREQTHLPCGSRSLTVANFNPGDVYGHHNIITGIISESRGIDDTDENNTNAGREGNRSFGPYVQWGLPPSGAGEAQAGRLIVLWEKKRFSPVLHVFKGVYYILEESTDSNDASVLRLVEINHFMKKRLNGKAVEWRIY
jgi:hypothetical protein